jgi:hypothetical protein
VQVFASVRTFFLPFLPFLPTRTLLLLGRQAKRKRTRLLVTTVSSRFLILVVADPRLIPSLTARANFPLKYLPHFSLVRSCSGLYQVRNRGHLFAPDIVLQSLSNPGPLLILRYSTSYPTSASLALSNTSSQTRERVQLFTEATCLFVLLSSPIANLRLFRGSVDAPKPSLPHRTRLTCRG